MKASISLATHSLCFTDGTEGLATERYAQCNSAFLFGQTAPASIHLRMISTSSGEMGPAGGIFNSPVRHTALNIRLSPDFHGTTAGPRFPPFLRASLPENAKPPMGGLTLGPWHTKQFLLKTSVMSCAYAGSVGSEPKSSAAITHHRTPGVALQLDAAKHPPTDFWRRYEKSFIVGVIGESAFNNPQSFKSYPRFLSLLAISLVRPYLGTAANNSSLYRRPSSSDGSTSKRHQNAQPWGQLTWVEGCALRLDKRFNHGIVEIRLD